MQSLIDHFDTLRPELERLTASRNGVSLSGVRLRPPLPRPSKILCCIGNYWEHTQRDPRPLNMFLKSPEAVVGPGDTVVLPDFPASVFHHEAELAIVIKGPAKSLKEADCHQAVFGYTCFIDVSAREEGRRTWRAGSFLGKSFDTFAPLGPCIVTADEIPDPHKLRVRFWVNGELHHSYTTDDMEHRISEVVAFASAVMTLNTGDLIACGTNHEGLGPLQDGDLGVIEIEGIGRMEVRVVDPLRRRWERGIYLGPDATAPAPRRIAH
jgi:2-keto-4-pentenoate hydratase/2-oxohepta-3-ene-1,7-dioic acid hydratase in catechol pathway